MQVLNGVAEPSYSPLIGYVRQTPSDAKPFVLLGNIESPPSGVSFRNILLFLAGREGKGANVALGGTVSQTL